MADETNNTNNTENTEKNWQDVADEIKNEVDEHSRWKQIGYISKNGKDCEPILLSTKYDNDDWPIVVKAPTGLNNPKYDWHTHEWVEQDATSNSYRLNDVEQKIESLQKTATNASKNNDNLQQSLSDISKSQKVQSQQLAQLLQLVAPIVAKDDGGKTNA